MQLFAKFLAALHVFSSPEARDNQLRTLQSNAASEKEKQNEPKYRDLYTDLLRKYRSSLANKKQADSSTNPGFASENTLIKKVMDIERGSIIQGAFFGLTAFCTIRYLPRGMVHLMNGKKLLQTKNASKNSQGTFVRKTFGEKMWNILQKLNSLSDFNGLSL